MLEEPYFITKLCKETMVEEDDDAVLAARPCGAPQPSVRWYKDGRALNLEGHNSAKYSTVTRRDGTAILVIARVQDEDEGEYECRISNNLGRISCFGQLSMRPGKYLPNRQNRQPLQLDILVQLFSEVDLSLFGSEKLHYHTYRGWPKNNCTHFKH